MTVFVSRVFLLGVVLPLVACSSLSSVTQSDKIDYQSASKDKGVAKLEVPPDLTTPRGERRYTVPSTTTTASGYNQSTSVADASNEAVLPQVTDMHIERDGERRWLVLDNKQPEQIWSTLRQFWQDSGFSLAMDQPETGIMETEWAENRAKIPQDIIRRTLGRVLDSLYSTSERDKFRLRVERGVKGGSEIYITHRGMQEQMVGTQKDRTVWENRPSDPELEIEFLSRLMVRLGMTEAQAKANIANKNQATSSAAPVSRVTLIDQRPTLSISEPPDRAWRLLGIALDHVHFTVEDRDRSKGMYFVRYVENKVEEEKGFFGRLFSSDKKIVPKRYQVVLTAKESGSAVVVLDEHGKAEASDVAEQILKLLDEQLR
ncbi:MAG: outer membrane protein assembly factor BamC [Ottowia sp.]|nr:outer membrane protein assembly factor BamC [Ottowia sp.]